MTISRQTLLNTLGISTFLFSPPEIISPVSLQHSRKRIAILSTVWREYLHVKLNRKEDLVACEQPPFETGVL